MARLEMEIYRKIGRIMESRNEWEQALEYTNRSKDMASVLGDDVALAQAYRSLGRVFWRLGEWEIAKNYFNKSVETTEKNGDRRTLASTYIDLGNVYSEQGDLELAVGYYENSLKLLDDVGDMIEISRAYNNLGEIYREKGEKERAITYYQKCIDLCQKCGAQHDMAYGLTNAAACFTHMNRLDEALNYSRKAQEIFLKIDDWVALSWTYMVFGMIYRNTREWEKAEDSFTRAVEVLSDLNTPFYLAQAHFEYGGMLADKAKLMRRGDTSISDRADVDEINETLAGARMHLGKSLELFEALGSNSLIAKATAMLEEIGL